MRNKSDHHILHERDKCLSLAEFVHILVRIAVRRYVMEGKEKDVSDAMRTMMKADVLPDASAAVLADNNDFAESTATSSRSIKCSRSTRPRCATSLRSCGYPELEDWSARDLQDLACPDHEARAAQRRRQRARGVPRIHLLAHVHRQPVFGAWSLHHDWFAV